MRATAAAAVLAGAAGLAPSDLVARAADARGGIEKLRATGVLHVVGSLRFEGSAPMDLEAYVDASGGRERGFLAFRQGKAYRALLLSGAGGHERHESAVYRPVEGAELAKLRGEVTTLLLAARFPADGTWKPIGAREARRESDGVVVQVSDDGRPCTFTVPGADGETRRVDAWGATEGIQFPRRVEARRGAESVWTLEIAAWQPHAFVLDELFAPPSPSGEPSLVLGEIQGAGATTLHRGITAGRAFLRASRLPAARALALARPATFTTGDALLEAARAGDPTAAGAAWIGARFDAGGRIVALERDDAPASSAPASPGDAWIASVMLLEPVTAQDVARGLASLAALAKARGLELEETALLRLPASPGRAASAPSRPAPRFAELFQRVAGRK